MEDKIKDLIKYGVSLVIQIAVTWGAISIWCVVNKVKVFSGDNFMLLVMGLVISVAIMLLFMIFLGLKQFFMYEFFTYGMMLFGFIMIVTGFFHGELDAFLEVFGISLFWTGTFSRVVLWKYDRV